MDPELKHSIEQYRTMLQSSYLNNGKSEKKDILPAISIIKDLGDLLGSTENTKISSLCEVHKKIHELNAYSHLATSEDDALFACHTKGIELLSIIDNSLIQNFLLLPPTEQETLLNNQNKAEAIHQALKNPKLDQGPDAMGNYVFHLLCRSESAKTRKLATECLHDGFDINTQHKNGNTALHYAAMRNDSNLIRRLLTLGAEIRSNSDSNTPYDIAAQKGDFFSQSIIAIHDKDTQKYPYLISKLMFLTEVSPILIELLENCYASDKSEFGKVCKTFMDDPRIYDTVNKQNLDNAIKWLITNLKKDEPPNFNVMFCMNYLFTQMCLRNLTGPEDIKIIQQLEEKNLLSILPLFMADTETSPLTVIRKSDLVPQSIQTQLSVLPDDQTLALYRQFRMYTSSPLMLDPETLIKIVDTSIKYLEEKGFPEIEFLREEANKNIASAMLSLKKTNNAQIESKFSGVVSNDDLKKLCFVKNSIQTFFISTDYERIESFNNIERYLKDLEKYQLPEIESLKSDFEKKTAEYRIKSAINDEIYSKLKNNEISINDINLSIRYQMTLRAALNENYELMAKLRTIRSYGKLNLDLDKLNQFITNKTIFHLMMDKLKISESDDYKSSIAEINAHTLINLFNKMLKVEVESSSLSETIASNIEQLHKQVVPLLKNIVILSVLFPKNQSEMILQQLNTLENGKSILVPTGCKGHLTCLLVTKTDSTFKLNLYNTGLGIENHYRWNNSSLYQTHFTIENIPNSSMLNPDGWNQLLAGKESSQSMAPIYSHLKNVMGKDGRISPKSEHIEEYEAMQESGTCGMQSLMALIRDQCMELAAGTPAEKEALYKIVKNELLSTYLKENLSNIDKVINQYMGIITHKLEGERKLLRIADNQEEFQNSIVKIRQLLSLLGKEEELPVTNAETTLARYAILRKASSRLRDVWFEVPNRILPEDVAQLDVLQLAIAKIDQRNLTLQKKAS